MQHFKAVPVSAFFFHVSKEQFNMNAKCGSGILLALEIQVKFLIMSSETFHWSCKHTWSKKKTAWCLLGCSIGDFGTILFFQLTQIAFPVLAIMTLAIINRIITSFLETIILLNKIFLLS